MRRVSLLLIGIALAAANQSAMAHGNDGQDKKVTKPKAAAVEEKSFGRAGDPGKITRTIEISMTDQLRYDPAEVRVRAGDTVKFVVRNRGKVLHELVLGTLPELKEHAELMRRFPDMEHDEAHMAHVKVGMKEDIVWQFTKPGEFHFGCLIPGHFEAGMVGKVIVAGK